MRQEVQTGVLERVLAAVKSRALPEGDEERVPKSNYTSPERFAAECEALFRRGPIVVGHLSELEKPGDFITHDASGVPLLITKGPDGELRAFLNACRHRGTRVVNDARGTKKLFACPYHAWTYDLTGRLTHIPIAEGFPRARCEELSLVRVPLATDAGLIWVVPTAGAEPQVASALGPIGEDLSAFGLDRHVVHRRTVEERACNWKLVIDAFLEGYHVKALHHDTVARFFLDAMVVDAHGPHVRFVGARRNITELTSVPRDRWNVRDVATVFYFLFPNTVLVFHPDWVSLLSMFPRTVERAVYSHTMLVPDPPRDDAERAHWDKTWDLIEGNVFQRQDVWIAENVQSTLAATADDSFRIGRLEQGIHRFHAAIDRAIGG